MKSQVSTLPSIIKVLHKPWLLMVLKAGVLLGSCYLVYAHLSTDNLWEKLYLQLIQIEVSNPLIVFALLLLPANWGIEAWRWKELANKIEQVSYWQAAEGVLTGVALGFVTPSFIGDFLGRTFQLHTKARNRTAGSLVVNSASQFIVTYFFGCIGILLFAQASLLPFGNFSTGMAVTMIVTAGGAIWLFFNSRLFIDAISRAYPKLFLNKLLAIIGEYSEAELARTLLLSALRYCVFSLQFYLLLLYFGVDLPGITLCSGIFIVFFVKTIIPSLSLVGDLGLREMSAILFFKQFGAADEKVVAACLLLWFINLLIPTLVGLVFILKIRFWHSA